MPASQPHRSRVLVDDGESYDAMHYDNRDSGETPERFEISEKLTVICTGRG